MLREFSFQEDFILSNSRRLLQTVPLLLQEQVRKDEGGHAFDNHRGAHGDARVVAPAGGERSVFATATGGLLFL